MILLLALVAGLLVGLAWARWRKQPYHVPELGYLWLVLIAFLPQFITIYLPLTRQKAPNWLSVASLLASQILFLGFTLLNRRVPGMSVLIGGLVLNLAVMAVNAGFMPISPQTASRLVSAEVLRDYQPGDRFGTKDILLLPQDTRFEWLADRFLPPAGSPYQVAFSLGDVLIATGVFWLLANQETPESSKSKGTLS